MRSPPGFRFEPTDAELVGYYLRRKLEGRSNDVDIVPEIDIYKHEPWDLLEQTCLPGGDWYFFCPRDRKYPKSLRSNRATRAGFWKATGKDRVVQTADLFVGMRKTLVFHTGRAPSGERTDWVMHEYRWEDEKGCGQLRGSQDRFVLCRVFKKNGLGPRNGNDRGSQTCVEDETGMQNTGHESALASFDDAVQKAMELDLEPSPEPQPPPPSNVEASTGDSAAVLPSLVVEGGCCLTEDELKCDEVPFSVNSLLPENYFCLEDDSWTSLLHRGVHFSVGAGEQNTTDESATGSVDDTLQKAMELDREPSPEPQRLSPSNVKASTGDSAAVLPSLVVEGGSCLTEGDSKCDEVPFSIKSLLPEDYFCLEDDFWISLLHQ